MNIHRMSMAIAFVGAALAAAGTTTSLGARQAGVSLVAQAAAAEQPGQSDQQEYIHKNEGWFTQWGRKIDRFNQEAAQKSAKVKQSAKKNLDSAWDEVKERWADLKQAGSDGWQKAKDAYEKSQRKLERAWHDATS